MLLIWALYISLKRNIEFIDRFEEIENRIEIAVKVLEEQYSRIEEKSKIEVFSDDPIVRDFVEDISIAKEAVFKISKFLEMDNDEIEKNKNGTEKEI